MVAIFLRSSALLFALVLMLKAVLADERVWTDRSGKFTVTAEFQSVEEGNVVLLRADGNKITVPIDRLSEADRAFVKAQETANPGALAGAVDEAAETIIAQIAETFYNDLRTQERTAARDALTEKAAALLKGGQSPLAGLPEPDQGNRTIRLGRVQLEDGVGEIPVIVRAGGKLHKTKLHLRLEDDAWRVFALSATYPDGEKSINFEAEVVPQHEVDPLQAIVGKTFELEGITLDGQPLSMSDYEGKVVLVDFWATWCGPCRAEIPNIAANWQQYHNDGFEVIAVSVDQDLAALKSFVAEEKPPWAVVADNHPRNKRSMAAKYGIRGIPAFILVGRDGKVATVHCRGPQLGKQLSQLIRGGGQRLSEVELASDRPSLVAQVRP